MTYNLGQAVQLSTTVTDSAGAATDATVALTVTKPDGTTITPSVTHTGTGGYQSASFTVDQAGTWWWRWDAAGAIVQNDRGQFDVGDPKPPAYTSLLLVKASLGIDPADTTRDVLLTAKVNSACRSIDYACNGRQFWLDQSATARIVNPRYKTVNEGGTYKLLVDDIGSAVGLVVEVGFGSAWTAIADYETGPDNAIAKRKPITELRRDYQPFAYTLQDRVRITAHWGWPSIPDPIAEAALLQACRFWKRKDSPEGVLGSAEWGGIRVTRVDPDVQALIMDFLDGATG